MSSNALPTLKIKPIIGSMALSFIDEAYTVVDSSTDNTIAVFANKSDAEEFLDFVERNGPAYAEDYQQEEYVDPDQQV